MGFSVRPKPLPSPLSSKMEIHFPRTTSGNANEYVRCCVVREQLHSNAAFALSARTRIRQRQSDPCHQTASHPSSDWYSFLSWTDQHSRPHAIGLHSILAFGHHSLAASQADQISAVAWPTAIKSIGQSSCPRVRHVPCWSTRRRRCSCTRFSLIRT